MTSHPSEFNTLLKVAIENGKKVLNTRDANYSYGGLQELLEYGLDFIPPENIQKVLILGLGAGSVIDSLRNKYRITGKITGVEIDPVVINLAKEEFDIDRFEDFELIEADAAEFVKNTFETFDLIVVDIFINTGVPAVFYEKEFWENVESLVSNNGFVLFNAGIEWNKGKMYDFLQVIPGSFAVQKYHNILGSSSLLLMHKIYF